MKRRSLSHILAEVEALPDHLAEALTAHLTETVHQGGYTSVRYLADGGDNYECLAALATAYGGPNMRAHCHPLAQLVAALWIQDHPYRCVQPDWGRDLCIFGVVPSVMPYAS